MKWLISSSREQKSLHVYLESFQALIPTRRLFSKGHFFSPSKFCVWTKKLWGLRSCRLVGPICTSMCTRTYLPFSTTLKIDQYIPSCSQRTNSDEWQVIKEFTLPSLVCVTPFLSSIIFQDSHTSLPSSSEAFLLIFLISPQWNALHSPSPLSVFFLLQPPYMLPDPSSNIFFIQSHLTSLMKSFQCLKCPNYFLYNCNLLSHQYLLLISYSKYPVALLWWREHVFSPPWSWGVACASPQGNWALRVSMHLGKRAQHLEQVSLVLGRAHFFLLLRHHAPTENEKIGSEFKTHEPWWICLRDCCSTFSSPEQVSIWSSVMSHSTANTVTISLPFSKTEAVLWSLYIFSNKLS